MLRARMAGQEERRPRELVLCLPYGSVRTVAICILTAASLSLPSISPLHLCPGGLSGSSFVSSFLICIPTLHILWPFGYQINHVNTWHLTFCTCSGTMRNQSTGCNSHREGHPAHSPITQETHSYPLGSFSHAPLSPGLAKPSVSLPLFTLFPTPNFILLP